MKSRDEIIKRLDEIYSMNTLVRSKLTTKTVIDPDKSVNWNIQEIARINQQIDEERKEAKHKQRRELGIAMDDVFDYMRNMLDEEDPPDAVLQYIYDAAFEDGHYAGMHEVFSYLDIYIEFVNGLDELRRCG